MDQVEVGKRLRARREELGLGVRELSRLSGVTAGQISKIELGQVPEIRSGTLMRLCYRLGVTTDWLLGSYDPDQDEKLADEEEMAPAIVNMASTT